MQNYDVIIVGGGPTGIALAIELGLNNINTLILEKHAKPLLSPRAQSLNARSMEFFRRWKLADDLKSKQLLPPDYPIRGVWCSKLNGKTYAISSSNEQLNDHLSPERGVRIPLWLTEEVLRHKLQQFPCIHFLKQQKVVDVTLQQNHVSVIAENSDNQLTHFQAPYVVACDGANSITRNKVGIPFEKLAEPRRAISVLFEAPTLEKQITVEKGFLFYLLGNQLPGAIGPIDPVHGLWTAQIGYNGEETTIEQVDVDSLLEELAGLSFPKKIIKSHFWDMHIEAAKHFSRSNRVFLVGDSAHAFVPTGGFGLNTGLGDAINLGWKLAAVIKQQAHPSLLETYEQERLPIGLHNLNLAQKNANDMVALRKRYDPLQNPEEFAKANVEIANQFAYSQGATMGYTYFNSPLTKLNKNQSIVRMSNTLYEPTVAPGYFLPHVWVDKQSIYDLLSATNWTLIVSGENESDHDNKWRIEFAKHTVQLDILSLPNTTYPFKYVLIRPDWHIALVCDEMENEIVENYFNLFF